MKKFEDAATSMRSAVAAVINSWPNALIRLLIGSGQQEGGDGREACQKRVKPDMGSSKELEGGHASWKHACRRDRWRIQGLAAHLP